jgi:hypothetical protein
MSTEELTTYSKQQQRTTERDIDEEAAALLGSWFPIVGAMPQLIGAKQHEGAVRELVAWYEHVFSAGGYCADPPLEGLDALVDELVHVSVPPNDHAELANGRWAVRVAEELVVLRRRLRDDGSEAVPTGPATDRLELAIAGARRHIAGLDDPALRSARIRDGTGDGDCVPGS